MLISSAFGIRLFLFMSLYYPIVWYLYTRNITTTSTRMPLLRSNVLILFN
jgi:hypothetical protein